MWTPYIIKHLILQYKTNPAASEMTRVDSLVVQPTQKMECMFFFSFFYFKILVYFSSREKMFCSVETHLWQKKINITSLTYTLFVQGCCIGVQVFMTLSLHATVLEKGLEKYPSQCPLRSVWPALLSTAHYTDSDLQLVAVCDTLSNVCDISGYYFSVLFIGVSSHELKVLHLHAEHITLHIV